MTTCLLLLLSLILLSLLLLGQFNHKKLFLFGVCYYFILPIIVGENKEIFNIIYFEHWFETFELVNINEKLFIIFYSIILFLAYLLGCKISQIIGYKNNSFITANALINKKGHGLGQTSSLLISILIFFICIPIWIHSSHFFFQGYSVGYDSSIMGKMVTLNLLLTTFVFCIKKSVSLNIKIFSFGLVITNSLLLLSMGGRMYVLIFLIFMISWFYDSRKIPNKIIIAFIIASFLLITVGVIRSHSVSINLFSYIALAEPVFTSFSLFSFLTHDNNFHYFNFPTNFLNAFLLILPNFLDYKKSLMINMEDLGFVFYAPLGATSLIVSLIGNFGTIGGVFFILLMSTLIETIRYSQNVVLRVFYTMLCSVIPFMLFRDSFGIVIKVSIFTGLILPSIFMLIARILKH
ncbi:hypothetical protein [Photorhabdus sp. RM96S]|uniref:hypothetical protein n=1 Tax=Photorhabdus sp. RM96S TaxID=3342822 RepID=UPI0036DA9A9C